VENVGGRGLVRPHPKPEEGAPHSGHSGRCLHLIAGARVCELHHPMPGHPHRLADLGEEAPFILPLQLLKGHLGLGLHLQGAAFEESDQRTRVGPRAHSVPDVQRLTILSRPELVCTIIPNLHRTRYDRESGERGLGRRGTEQHEIDNQHSSHDDGHGHNQCGEQSTSINH